MVWTILAVVLILNGFFNNDAWEIASAVLFGALGFRRAVMQWEKPRAVMNFGVIVFAIGLALWQMGRGEEQKRVEREAERAPAVTEERTTGLSPRPAVTEQRRDIAQSTTFSPVAFDGKPSTEGVPAGVWSDEIMNHDGCRIIFDADGDFEYQAEFKTKFGGDSWKDYSDTLEWKGQDNIWQMWAFRVKVVSGEARKLLYARDCNYVTVHDHPPLLSAGTMVKIPVSKAVKGLAPAPTSEDIEQSLARGYTYVFGNEPVMRANWSEWIPNEKGCEILFDSADSFRYMVEIRTFAGGSVGGWFVDSPDGNAFVSPEGVNYSANVASVRAQVLSGTPNHFRYRQLCSEPKTNIQKIPANQPLAPQATAPTNREFPATSMLFKKTEGEFGGSGIYPDEELITENTVRIELGSDGRSQEYYFPDKYGSCELQVVWSGDEQSFVSIEVLQSGDEWKNYVTEVEGGRDYLVWWVYKMRIASTKGNVNNLQYVQWCKRKKK